MKKHVVRLLLAMLFIAPCGLQAMQNQKTNLEGALKLALRYTHQGNFKAVAFFLNAIVERNCQDHSDSRFYAPMILEQAAEKGCLDAVKYICEKFSGSVATLGWTTNHIPKVFLKAVKKDRRNIVQYLVEKHKDCITIGGDQITPTKTAWGAMKKALKKNNAVMCQYLMYKFDYTQNEQKQIGEHIQNNTEFRRNWVKDTNWV